MPGKEANGYPARSAGLLKESKSYCEGQLARQQDKLITDNPHTGGNAKDSWNRGWFLIDQQAPTATPNVGDCCAALGAIGGTATPIIAVWVDAIPAVSAAQGEAWTINLNDYIAYGSTPITFTVDTGGPPTGITLSTDGTFTGTVTNVGGGGSITFIATNAAGASVASPTLNWTIG